MEVGSQILNHKFHSFVNIFFIFFLRSRNFLPIFFFRFVNCRHFWAQTPAIHIHTSAHIFNLAQFILDLFIFQFRLIGEFRTGKQTRSD